jgi:Taurine catabolism dioxygenase TauD, TfdA family
MAKLRTSERLQRLPAAAMQRVVDPADWSAADLSDVASWSYRFTDADADELAEGVRNFRTKGLPIESVARENFVLSNFAQTLAEVRRDLTDGRGIVMLKGFPLERFDREDTIVAYLGLGAYLGSTMVQNKFGHILGHVKDLGGDYADPLTRGYMTSAEMLFHADACDYVGLLCLKTAMSGGASRVASSVAVYNRILAERPDLAEVLTQDFYRSLSGENNPGDKPWFTQPIFSFTDGFFSATGAGAAIDKAQALPGVPSMTAIQKEAVAFYRKTVHECAVDISFEPGDIQFLNNFVTLHTRRAYQDWPEFERRRHLLRLWLRDENGRPIPEDQRRGRSGSGIKIDGLRISAPLDVGLAA